VIWREYSAKAIRETTNKYLKKARDRPSDYHGDPYAFDIQALYDVITRKLNALGGEQMPKGARYGVHPLRLRKANGLDIGNGSGQLHEFPHQSDPQVKADTGLKKPGWWLAGSKAEAELESEAEALWERERFDPEWSGEDEERSGEEESLADTHDFEDEDVEAAMGEESLDGEESGWSGEAMVPWRESALHDETGEERLAWLDFEDPLTAAFEDEVESPQYEAPPRAVRAPAAKPMLGGMVWTAMHRPTWTKVTTFVTPQALKQERVEVLFFVHGLLGPCGRPLHGMESLIASKTFRLAANAVASGRPIILVVPQFQDGDDASWRSRGLGQPATLNRMMAAALLEVSRRTGTAAPQASALIVAGHSRAYGVLFELARAHASSALAEGALERLSEIWALDASYGSFPHQAFEALLAAKPALKVSVVYRADSPTDKFKGKAVAGRLALIPVDARVVSHCAVPAHAMPKLLAGEAVDRAPTKQGEAGSALHEHQEHIAGVLDEETQMMTWQESEAERSRVCPTCGSQIAEAGGMWPDRERGFEAEGGFDALDFEEFADFANETDLMFEESGYEADFVSEASGSSSFALLRAIPDNADYARFVPLDYRLNAKAIVGKLATDLEQLKDPSAKDLRKFAEDVSKFVSGGSPVGVMTKILVGALKNIPGGYLAAAAKIADDYAARGFSRGIVLGAARKSQSYLIDTFGREFIPENRPFPLGRKIAAANYVGGLLAGYVQGKALSKNQHVIFWKDLGRRMGDQSYRGATSTWRTKEWRDWYVDVAAAFRRYHLSS
jgi:hypothetical protein